MNWKVLIWVLILLEAESVFDVSVPVELVRKSAPDELAHDLTHRIPQRKHKYLKNDNEKHARRRHKQGHTYESVIFKYKRDSDDSQHKYKVKAINNLNIRIPEIVEHDDLH